MILKLKRLHFLFQILCKFMGLKRPKLTFIDIKGKIQYQQGYGHVENGNIFGIRLRELICVIYIY